MPTILHLNTIGDPRNGVGQIMHALHDAALQHGYRSLICAAFGQPDMADNILSDRKHYLFNVLKARTFGDDGFLGASSCVDQLERIFAVEKPDLVHLHNLHGYYCDIVRLDAILRNYNVPVVVTMHDRWLASPRCAHPNQCPSCGCGACNYSLTCLRRYPAKWLPSKSRLEEKKAFLNDKHIVVPSQWMDRKVPYPSIVIPNGVDTNIFCKREPVNSEYPIIAKPGSEYILSVASKWTYDKGADILPKIAESLPDNMYLVVVGSHAPRHKNIVHTGPISDAPRLATLINGATALINPSRYESFGLTVAEALACGTPAIVRQDTACAELVGDKNYIVDFDNINEVTGALAHARKHTFQPVIYSIERTKEAYLNLYDAILNRNTATVV